MKLGQKRTFAALIDQDGVALVEYRRESERLRVVGSRIETRRFDSVEAAADTVVSMLAAERAGNASLAVAIQHFGAFYHTMALPPAPDAIVRPIVEREVARLFQVTDPVVAFARGETAGREPQQPDGPKAPRQVVVAGLPRQIVVALQSRFADAQLSIEILTVVPEALRRVYDAIDGSPEPTAMLVCLASGPHLAFFVDGKLELAIDPPIALEGERMLDPLLVVDQVERGGVFLRQQSRGATATRAVIAAEPQDYAAIATALEAHTSLQVQPLGNAIGSPEAIIAIGAVLGARSRAPLDLYPHRPSVATRVRSALKGPGGVVAAFATAAAIAMLWAGVGFTHFSRTRAQIAALNDSITGATAAIAPLRPSVEQRASVVQARSALQAAATENRQLIQSLSMVANGAPPGVDVDSMSVRRTADGWRTSLRLHATAATGGQAIKGLNGLYGYLKSRPELKNVTLGDSLVWHSRATDSSLAAITEGIPEHGVRVSVSLSFVAPTGGHR